jgi:hypothetical protein
VSGAFSCTCMYAIDLVSFNCKVKWAMTLNHYSNFKYTSHCLHSNVPFSRFLEDNPTLKSKIEECNENKKPTLIHSHIQKITPAPFDSAFSFFLSSLTFSFFNASHSPMLPLTLPPSFFSLTLINILAHANKYMMMKILHLFV